MSISRSDATDNAATLEAQLDMIAPPAVPDVSSIAVELKTYKDNAELIKLATKENDQLKKTILAFLGDAKAGQIDGEPVVIVVRTEQQRINSDLVRELYPLIVEEVTK